MAVSRRNKQSRKNRSRKNRKQSRRNRQSQKNRQSQRSQRSQRGGGSCSAYPLNRQLFQQQRGQTQRGGMAPFDSIGQVLDHATMVQAESAGQVSAIAQAQVLARAPHPQNGGRRQSRRSQRQRQRRNQRGGVAPFLYELTTPAGADKGMNPQFQNEGSVNALYGEYKGAQGL